MTDIADEANNLNEFFLAQSLKSINRKVPAFSGQCLFCEEPVGKQRYCDRYCREQHEKQTKRNR